MFFHYFWRQYWNQWHKSSGNKFEVSKIYMTACMCIYKFCQIKEYFLMIFSCFIQKKWMIFLWFFMIFHVLLKILNNVLSHFKGFSCFIQVFYVLFKILYSYIKCEQKVHTIMNRCIQVGLSAYIRYVTCRTAYIRKRSKTIHKSWTKFWNSGHSDSLSRRPTCTSLTENWDRTIKTKTKKKFSFSLTFRSFKSVKRFFVNFFVKWLKGIR